MAEVDHLLYFTRRRNDLPTDRILHTLLVPFLSTCTTLGIGKNNMRHQTPWAKQNAFRCSPCAEWKGIFLYLHVNEGWQLSDFSNFLGRQGTIKACLQFPQLAEGDLVHLLLESSSLIGSKTRILDLFPRLFWLSKKLSYESSSDLATILGSRTIVVGQRFIFRYIGHLEWRFLLPLVYSLTGKSLWILPINGQDS